MTFLHSLGYDEYPRTSDTNGVNSAAAAEGNDCIGSDPSLCLVILFVSMCVCVCVNRSVWLYVKV